MQNQLSIICQEIMSTGKVHTLTSVLDELERVLETQLTDCSVNSDEETKATKVFACSDCDLITNSEQVIKLHRQNQHKDKRDLVGYKISEKHKSSNAESVQPWFRGKGQTLRKCNICNIEKQSGADLVKHYREEHKGEKIFKCDICDYGCNWFSNIKSHKESKHEHKTYQCDLCDYKTKWKVPFLNHKREVHDSYSYKRATKLSKMHKLSKPSNQLEKEKQIPL